MMYKCGSCKFTIQPFLNDFEEWECPKCGHVAEVITNIEKCEHK